MVYLPTFAMIFAWNGKGALPNFQKWSHLVYL